MGLEDRAHVPVQEMSHGEQKQLELAIALGDASRDSSCWTNRWRASVRPSVRQRSSCCGTLKRETTILLVEHDMDAVFALADRISVLVDGQCITTGSADEVRNNETVRIAYLGEGNV